MEDRYLYKAKTTPKEKGEFNNVWVTGNLIVSNGKYYIHPVGNVVNVKNETGRIIVMHEVIPDTICRCTESKDKNGKLIWENDIASYSDLITRDKKTICIERNKMQASFVRKYRSPMGLQYLYLDEYIASRMEVIGNIFDNPELLESEEK